MRVARLSEDLDIDILNGDRERVEAPIAGLGNAVAGHHYPLHDAAPNSVQRSPLRSSLAAIACLAVS